MAGLGVGTWQGADFDIAANAAMLGAVSLALGLMGFVARRSDEPKTWREAMRSIDQGEKDFGRLGWFFVWRLFPAAVTFGVAMVTVGVVRLVA